MQTVCADRSLDPSVMVTLSLTDLPADYPDAVIQVHNLGGNIPFEIERKHP